MHVSKIVSRYEKIVYITIMLCDSICVSIYKLNNYRASHKNVVIWFKPKAINKFSGDPLEKESMPPPDFRPAHETHFTHSSSHEE
jgi:hypothetical protein